MKYNIYFYGDIGDYNQFNPAWVLNNEISYEFINLLARNDAYTLNRNDILKNIPKAEEVINHFSRIKAITEEKGNYKLNFSVFLEEDLVFLRDYLKQVGKIIGDKVISLQDEISHHIRTLSPLKKYKKERILYHVISDQIFDGHAFDYFSEKNLFSMSKRQVDNRDYIIFAYEDCKLEHQMSKEMFCSSNNAFTSKYIFNSFGDSNGNRLDVFRYFRLIDQAIDKGTPFQSLNHAYLKVLKDNNKRLLERCGDIIDKIDKRSLTINHFSIEEQSIIKFLIEMKYLKINEEQLMVCVPIFRLEDLGTIKNLSSYLLRELYPVLKEIFKQFEKDAQQMTPLKHGINIKEIANELWHQIFGRTNQYLMEQSFVDKPKHCDGEGRFFRSLQRNSEVME